MLLIFSAACSISSKLIVDIIFLSVCARESDNLDAARPLITMT